ncbi:MAG: BMP family ABC transporter substrate-binding protein [Clostridium sp.]|nr:BMP family ABC transporter substrate-binding protein [Clostridium sp.]
MKNLNRFTALALTGIVALSLAACGGGKTGQSSQTAVSETQASEAKAAPEGGALTESGGEPFRVALMVGVGGIGDGGFNDSMLAGVKNAEADYGIEYQLVEPKEVSEFEANFTDLSASGKYDLIIGGGFDAVEALQKVASEFPEQKYLFVDGEVADCDNVTSVLFKDNEKTYLVGTVAALNTKTNKIGMVVGVDSPSQNVFVAGYMAGAKAANPDVEVMVKYVGSFADTTTAKELALAESEAGADIIFAAAGGSGLGVFNAAQQGGFKAIGADVNQCLIDPDSIMLSAIRKIDVVIKDGVKSAIDGTLEGGTMVPGLKEDALGITNEGSNVEIDPASLAAADTAREKIIAGEITVPSTIDEVK